MPAAPDPDLARLQMILQLAALIRSQLSVLTEEQFLADRLQIDSVAYRLGSIGEYARKLSTELKERHPTIDWRGMYTMRNIVFHDYAAVLRPRLWEAAGDPLTQLEEVCRAELLSRDATDSPDASP